MGYARGWRRRRAGVRSGLSILLAFCVAFFSVARISTFTPVGRQCPMAPVQTIRVAVMLPCGHCAGYMERAPRPGEKGFVQCHCDEKRSSSQIARIAPEIMHFRTAAKFVVPAPALERPEKIALAPDPAAEVYASPLLQPPSNS